MKKLKDNQIEYVYVIKDKHNRYKIGSSKHPRKRLKQLQTGNSEKLLLCHLIKCTRYPAKHLEKRIHYWFRFNKIKTNNGLLQKLQGEWYCLNEEELEFLKSIKTDLM